MTRILTILFCFAMATALPSCMTKRQQAEKERIERQAKIDQAKRRLNLLLTDRSRSLEDREKDLTAIKGLKIDDPEVDDLILRVEEKLLAERREKDLKAEADRIAREKKEKEKALQDSAKHKLLALFEKIAKSETDDDADSFIKEALHLFDTEQVPVLIVISKSGEQRDYDRPTTIKRYLELIKDQKRYESKFENIIFNEAGKITELELLK